MLIVLLTNNACSSEKEERKGGKEEVNLKQREIRLSIGLEIYVLCTRVHVEWLPLR